jgi:hypothetical protein
LTATLVDGERPLERFQLLWHAEEFRASGMELSVMKPVTEGDFCNMRHKANHSSGERRCRKTKQKATPKRGPRSSYRGYLMSSPNIENIELLEG